MGRGLVGPGDGVDLTVLHPMEEPIEFRGPGSAVGVRELLLKILESFLFGLVHGESLAEVI